MYYQTIITQKGQITIPKHIREVLGLFPSRKVVVELDKEKNMARVRGADHFFEVARSFHPKKKLNPLTARRKMEKQYERA